MFVRCSTGRRHPGGRGPGDRPSPGEPSERFSDAPSSPEKPRIRQFLDIGTCIPAASPRRGLNAWIPRDGSGQVGPGADEAVLVGVHDGLNAVAQLEFAEYPAD